MLIYFISIAVILIGVAAFALTRSKTKGESMSYDESIPRGTTLGNLSASAPDGSSFTPAARPVVSVKTPSFKAPKTIGKKPAVIAKGKKVTTKGK
jgi:hypothetical protein